MRSEEELILQSFFKILNMIHNTQFRQKKEYPPKATMSIFSQAKISEKNTKTKKRRKK